MVAARGPKVAQLHEDGRLLAGARDLEQAVVIDPGVVEVDLRRATADLAEALDDARAQVPPDAEGGVVPHHRAVVGDLVPDAAAGRLRLALGGEPGEGAVIAADLTDTGLIESLVAASGTFFAEPGRMIRISAIPETRPDERITVIVPEAPLRRALIDFSIRIFWLSIFISLMAGTAIYIALLVLLVRPMRRLARAMTAFQEDPSDPQRTFTPSRRRDEIGESERALAAMQADVRDAFRQREHLAALGGAVAKINHDLRNVLASAQLISDRLAMSSDERVAGMGARLVRAIDRGVRLCQETLEYGRSREKAPELRPVRLADALDDAAGDALASSGAAQWINEVDELITVSADPDHLHRIFLNLFRNALQAMEESDPRRLSVASREEAGQVIVHVSDTGPGIPARVRETLFAPFSVTGHRAGTGLGLSIARELARLLGGDIALEASGEEGAVFKVTLKAV